MRSKGFNSDKFCFESSATCELGGSKLKMFSFKAECPKLQRCVV